MYSITLLLRLMHCSSPFHFGAVEKVLRYVDGMIKYGIKSKKNIDTNLVGYSDNDSGCCIDDKKSTFGYCFTFRIEVFLWSAKK